MRNKDSAFALVLIMISIGIALLFIISASKRELTDLENALFQVLSLGAGLLGSYILGKQSTRAAAIEMVKPHARSAFRRVMSLYMGLSRLAGIIENTKDSVSPHVDYLNIYQAVVMEQIATADDAMEDWRDLVPEDVEELEKKIIRKRYRGAKDE